MLRRQTQKHFSLLNERNLFMKIETKRVYEPEEKSDGYRILVDRLWPRGVSKEKADLDDWFKEIAPSPDLRKWFDHDPDKFQQFKLKYLEELRSSENEGQKKEIDKIKTISRDSKVTLLYGAKSHEINHAVVLQEFLEG